MLYGTQKKSERSLPGLHASMLNQVFETYLTDTEKIDPSIIQNDTTFSFSTATRLVSQVDPIILSAAIRGNIVIHSFDSIYVAADAQLEHVILIAPYVRFQKVFRGQYR